jgi:transcriptional regulator with XRE-family HTH domain
MGKTSAPPLDGEAIRRARLRKFLTQAEVAGAVAQQCSGLGIKFDRSGLSMIENGQVKRPSLKVVPVLAEVLGMEVEEMFADEDVA